MELREAIVDIIKFMRDRKFEIDPLPKIMIDDQPNRPDDPFIKTGNYSFEDQSITLFVNNRHMKDILRSFCHEMVHHNQFLRDPDGTKKQNLQGDLQDNNELKKVEREAYDKGNLMFRWWTESKQSGRF